VYESGLSILLAILKIERYESSIIPLFGGKDHERGEATGRRL
jgi:hypothetical protein